MRPSDFAIVSTPKFASAKRRRRRTSSSVHRKRGFLAVTYNLAPSPGLSIRGRQPSHGKFDLTVGELTPIFDNGRMATDSTFIEDLAGLSTSLLHRQSEILM